MAPCCEFSCPDGSYEKVNRFIGEIQAKTSRTRGYERYAELYFMYVGLEGDEIDLFADTPAYWSGVRSGYVGLLKRYPKSRGSRRVRGSSDDGQKSAISARS
jgi:hypothetical protein